VQVKAAMNDINAAQRLRVAAADKAEAAKIKVGGLTACTVHSKARQGPCRLHGRLSKHRFQWLGD
jgi:hypothetical protein